MAISRRWAGAFVLAVTVTGCSATMPRPPGGWIPDLETAERQAHGAMVTARLREPLHGSLELHGELLASDEDSLLILMPWGPASVPQRAIRRGTLEHVDARGVRVRSNLLARGPGMSAPEDLARFPRATTVRARAWLAAAPAIGDSATAR